MGDNQINGTFEEYFGFEVVVDERKQIQPKPKKPRRFEKRYPKPYERIFK